MRQYFVVHNTQCYDHHWGNTKLPANNCIISHRLLKYFKQQLTLFYDLTHLSTSTAIKLDARLAIIVSERFCLTPYTCKWSWRRQFKYVLVIWMMTGLCYTHILYCWISTVIAIWINSTVHGYICRYTREYTVTSDPTVIFYFCLMMHLYRRRNKYHFMVFRICRGSNPHHLPYSMLSFFKTNR